MKKILLVSFVLVFAAALLVSSIDGSFAAEKKAKKLTKVILGASPLATWIPIWAAKEKGYFEEEGLDVEIKIFQNSTKDILPLLANNSLDVGCGGLNVGFYNALMQGINLKLVGSEGQNIDNFSILVSKKLYTGTKEELKAEHLKGQIFAVPMKGYPQEITIDKFLNKYGLTTNDVTLVTMSWPNINAGLANGSVFGASTTEPFRFIAIRDNIALEIEKAGSLTPRQQGGALLFSEKFSKKKKAGTAFMAAVIRGNRYFKDWEAGKVDDNEFYPIMKKYTSMDNPAILKGLDLGYKDPDAGLNVEGMKQDLQWYKDHGYIERTPLLDEIVDLSFVKAALKKVGKYKAGENK